MNIVKAIQTAAAAKTAAASPAAERRRARERLSVRPTIDKERTDGHREPKRSAGSATA